MRVDQRTTVVVFSGGLDSTTLIYHLLDAGHQVRALSFDYGQRHYRELESARTIAGMLCVDHRVIDMTGVRSIFGTNALTDHVVGIPHGAYSPSTMSVTTVPNRNMIMLSVAIGWAISLKHDSVAFGAHSGQYTPYPDCQPQFAKAMNAVAHVCDNLSIEVLAPFIHWDKTAIVRRGIELGVPFELTWSCYEGGEQQCGKCSTCLDRDSAFRKLGVPTLPG